MVDIKGTTRKNRPRAQAVPDTPAAIVRPAWLTNARGRRLWDIKLARYAARGQNVPGCEDALAQYCALEYDLIKVRKQGREPTMAQVNGHRVYANEFHDTPASKTVTGHGGAGPGNPFSGNGKRATFSN